MLNPLLAGTDVCPGLALSFTVLNHPLDYAHGLRGHAQNILCLPAQCMLWCAWTQVTAHQESWPAAIAPESLPRSSAYQEPVPLCDTPVSEAAAGVRAAPGSPCTCALHISACKPGSMTLVVRLVCVFFGQCMHDEGVEQFPNLPLQATQTAPEAPWRGKAPARPWGARSSRRPAEGAGATAPRPRPAGRAGHHRPAARTAWRTASGSCSGRSTRWRWAPRAPLGLC